MAPEHPPAQVNFRGLRTPTPDRLKRVFKKTCQGDAADHRLQKSVLLKRGLRGRNEVHRVGRRALQRTIKLAFVALDTLNGVFSFNAAARADRISSSVFCINAEPLILRF
jgi:hypothetical protein